MSGLILPTPAAFNFRTSGFDARPGDGSAGTNVTPGNNTYGSYAEILSSSDLTVDCFLLGLHFFNHSSASSAKDTIVTIGIDPAGGTSWIDWIQHLLCSSASTVGSGGGVTYNLPLFVPAGASIAAKASENNASPTNVECLAIAYGKPDRPDMLKFGTGVETLGANTGASNGTTITSGTTSPGSWTSLGTTTKPIFAWDCGRGVNDTSLNSRLTNHCLAIGSGGEKIIMNNKKYYEHPSEGLNSLNWSPEYCETPIGSAIYGRGHCGGGSPNANESMVAYGIY